ncbi:hypothetical protein N0V94_007521 [Neodidymelliopsis sp. IMI 364377]|nr:hypothetical protein N0V94_007521 [Neodidymelliopsis sp. IMI 364377]
MDNTTSNVADVDSAPVVECTINPKPPVSDKKDTAECSCTPKPKLAPEVSYDSDDSDYRPPRRGRRAPLPPPVPQSCCPPPPMPIMYPGMNYDRCVKSSTQLLERIGVDDSIIDLPIIGRGNIYLATYDFGDKDVKKWSWLFAANIEEEHLTETSRVDSNGNDVPGVERVRQRPSNFSTIYNAGHIDIPCVYLSRALDIEVVPEDTEHQVRYFIVTKNRGHVPGSQLLVAESRKAAGTMMFYEILKGDSVVFVGATVHQCQTVQPKKFKKVASLEEAISVQDEGYVGIVC